MHAATIDSLYREHHQQLMRFLKRQLPCHEQAADLCHEVYLRLIRSDDIPALDNPRAYLFRIARNLLTDHHRRQANHLIAIDTLTPVLVCPRACPEARLCEQQCVHRLGEALSTLPDHLRQALIWHRMEGLTQREIGERLGVSERMAGRYIARAVTTCQAELETMNLPNEPSRPSQGLSDAPRRQVT